MDVWGFGEEESRDKVLPVSRVIKVNKTPSEWNNQTSLFVFAV